ncbi:hypothetical protein ATANTOWER_025664 [Ataeniobius toweri]|uniref:Uncharacterized protein n=1 Tax=Ataeniobius toweri TaxID=208326 RepID=A0ABU7BIQ2_9TELE|nr:hypothetical protein [Ataeniobius toweri]
MVGQKARKRSIGLLPRLETHSALSESWAYTQHRCWKKLGEGIEKRCGGSGRNRGMHAYIEELIEWTIMIWCLCWLESCLLENSLQRYFIWKLQSGCRLSIVVVIKLTELDGCEPEPGTWFDLYYP